MASEIKVDTISEKTSANGVTIDGVLVKDSVAHSGLVKLASSTASGSATLTFDNFVDNSTYSSYLIYFNDIVPATNTVDFYAIFRTGGASGANKTGTYIQAGYAAKLDVDNAEFIKNRSYTNYARLTIEVGTGTREALTGCARFVPSTTGVQYIHSYTLHARAGGGDFQLYDLGSAISTSDTITGISFLMETGNIASGNITIFGVKK